MAYKVNSTIVTVNEEKRVPRYVLLRSMISDSIDEIYDESRLEEIESFVSMLLSEEYEEKDLKNGRSLVRDPGG